MLHLIPPPLHRAALRLAHGLRKRWWRWRKPQLIGCRVVALHFADEQFQVLLIRQSYGSGQWMLPGGGLDRRETPLDAASRELREETGCHLVDHAVIEVLEGTLHGAASTVHVVAGRASFTARADGREVIEAAFFALDALPEDTAPFVREKLPEWVAAFGR